MKKIIFIAVTAAALTIGGCKTSESNYRAAYETAVQKKQESALDSATLAQVEQAAMPRPLDVDGVTLPVRTFPVGYPKDGGASRDNVRRYNVVVGQFRQIFNAKAMRGRLMARGYEDALVLTDRDQNYYVVAASVATPREAAAMLQKVSDDAGIVMKAPLPWILRPAHLVR